MDKKVVLFPHLKQRLIGDGLQFFKEKKYYEAIELLEEALVLGMDSSLFSMALLVSYNETNQLDKGKKLILQLLAERNSEYLKYLDLAVMIFHQTNEHELIIQIIDEALEYLEEEAFTNEIRGELEGIKQLSKDMITNKLNTNTSNLNLFGYETEEEQLNLTQELMNHTMDPYFNEVSNFLVSKNGQYFFKTILILMLEDKNDNSIYVVTKMNKEMKIIPKELKLSSTQQTKGKIIATFTNKLEHTNPTMLNQLIEYINRIYFIVYPFDFEQFDLDTIVKGFEKKLEDVFDLEDCFGSKDKYDKVVDSQIQRFYLLLSKLE